MSWPLGFRCLSCAEAAHAALLLPSTRTLRPNALYTCPPPVPWAPPLSPVVASPALCRSRLCCRSLKEGAGSGCCGPGKWLVCFMPRLCVTALQAAILLPLTTTSSPSPVARESACSASCVAAVQLCIQPYVLWAPVCQDTSAELLARLPQCRRRECALCPCPLQVCERSGVPWHS